MRRTLQRRRARRWRRLRRVAAGVSIAVLLGVALAVENPRLAYSMIEVIDAANIAQVASVVTNTQSLLHNATQQLGMLTSLQRNLGNGYNASSVVPQNLFTLSPTTGILGLSDNMTGLSNVSPILGSTRTFADTGSAINAVHTALGMTASMTPVQRQQVATQRTTAFDGAAQEAMGVALYTQQSAANTAHRISALAQQASNASSASAGDMRQQLAVLTSSVLMVAEELTELRALQAADVKMKASQALLSEPQTSVYVPPPLPTVGTGTTTGSSGGDSSVFGN